MTAAAVRAPRQVMFESDANGLTLVTVALYSVLRNADADKPVRILLAHDESFVAAGGIEQVCRTVARFPTASVVFANFTPLYEAHREKLERLDVRWPPMVWGWVFADHLFPQATGRLVYIDLDTYTTGDLQELFDLDLTSGNHLMAMVAESVRTDDNFCNVTWSGADRALYNTGVIALDLDAWRREGMALKIADWFAAHKADVPFVEQDATNYVCRGRILRLPLKWNYCDNDLRGLKTLDLAAPLWRGLHPPLEALEAMCAPKIVHYMYTHKPHVYNHRPERNLFREAMIELGMITGRLPGENFGRWLEGKWYDFRYARLKRRALRMRAEAAR